MSYLKCHQETKGYLYFLLTHLPHVLFSVVSYLHFGIVFYTRASLVAQMVKNQPAKQETWIQLVG